MMEEQLEKKEGEGLETIGGWGGGGKQNLCKTILGFWFH
jgi:hypothetical protein